MRSLLWCEWCSRRFWLIALAASVIAPILFGDPLTFWGGYASFNSGQGWIYASDALTPCMIIGLLFGLMAFSGELGAGVTDFLLSRPVSWKKLLAAKLIVGLGMIVISALLALIAFRLVCPAQYLPFLTFGKLAGGLLGAVAAMSLFYIVGMACSVVLPGAVGAVLMILVAPVTAGILLLAVSSVAKVLGIQELSTLPGNSPWIAILPWMVGITFAALIAIRFGLTLSVAQRIRRYALAALAIAFFAGAVMLPFFTRGTSVLSGYYCNFSPDLSHAVVRVRKSTFSNPTKDHFGEMIDDKTRTFFWRGSDGMKKTDASRYLETTAEGIEWLDNSTAYVSQSSGSYRNMTRPTTITTLRLDKSGRLQNKTSPVEARFISRAQDFLSPDGKTAVFSTQFQDDDVVHRDLRFWDIKTGRLLPAKVLDNRYYNGEWWQSDSEYVWLDGHDVRHVIRVR